jgi:tRNA G18 (ribose-2'-O)-methylase SpoU
MGWREGETIPEMLGFASPDHYEKEREKFYSVQSYQARYHLFEEEVMDIMSRCNTHRQMVTTINAKFMHDREYHQRVLEMAKEVEPPSEEELERLMKRFGGTTPDLKEMP